MQKDLHPLAGLSAPAERNAPVCRESRDVAEDTARYPPAASSDLQAKYVCLDQYNKILKLIIQIQEMYLVGI